MDNIEIIKEKDLENIKGGATITVWTGVIITAIVVFLSGVIEGITNPKNCNG